MEQVLRCFVNSNGEDWEDKLPLAEFAMNSSESAATGYSPFFLLYGRTPVTPLSLAVPDKQAKEIPTLVAGLHAALEEARNAIAKLHDAIKRAANKQRIPYEFTEGE